MPIGLGFCCPEVASERRSKGFRHGMPELEDDEDEEVLMEALFVLREFVREVILAGRAARFR